MAKGGARTMLSTKYGLTVSSIRLFDAKNVGGVGQSPTAEAEVSKVEHDVWSRHNGLSMSDSKSGLATF